MGEENFFGLVPFGAVRIEALVHPVFHHTKVYHNLVEEAVAEELVRAGVPVRKIWIRSGVENTSFDRRPDLGVRFPRTPK